LFTQERVAQSAGLFLDGLLGPERRKTGWMRAEAAGDPGPWRQQAILGRGRGEADALRDVVRDYALEALSDPDAVLVIDEIGFLKQGRSSCGVGRQYTGSAGKITHYQIGAFAAYVSWHGHAFIDRALHLPKAWTDNPARLAAAHMPEGTGFATKRHLAAGMIERAIAAGVPFAWVAADPVYGVGEVETALRCAGRGYVLGVNATHPFHAWGRTPAVSGTAEEIAQALDASAWQRLSAGSGTKGPRLYDWAYLELATLDAALYPGCRWAIEDSFETAKTELGLDHNETRSWHGWHRHVSLVMLALAVMASIRHQANQPAPQKAPPRRPRTQAPQTQARQPSSAGRSRNSDASQHAWPSAASSPPTSSPGRSGDARTKPSHNAHT